MALKRSQIVDAAYATLRDRGLGGVSMRRLAQDLGVAPGALYYHVASKQDLLAAVADRILDDEPVTDLAETACRIRAALLRVRDSAEVISFVRVYRPEAVAPLRRIEQLFAVSMPADRARLAAQTLISYLLGFVAEEQNHAELVHAGILQEGPSRYSAETFQFGLQAILRGVGHPGPGL